MKCPDCNGTGNLTPDQAEAARVLREERDKALDLTVYPGYTTNHRKAVAKVLDKIIEKMQEVKDG